MCKLIELFLIGTLKIILCYLNIIIISLIFIQICDGLKEIYVIKNLNDKNL